MTLDEALATVEALRPSGYRPVRFRPYLDGATIRVAAVWTRDRRPWRMESGLATVNVDRHDERNRRESFIPLDVAGYVAADGQGKPVDRHVAVWVERAGPDDKAWLYAGATPDDHETIRARLALEKLLPRATQAALGADGRTRYSGVWGRSPSTTTTWWTNGIEWEDAYRKDTKTVEVTVWGAETPRMVRERRLEAAEKLLEVNPANSYARLNRAMSLMQLGETVRRSPNWMS